MRIRSWDHRLDAAAQIAALSGEVRDPGSLRLEIPSGGDGQPLLWTQLEPWTRSRGVTIGVIEGAAASPALEVGLCCDLVYLREGAVLRLALGPEPPAAGVIWALGRAGRAALARGLLDPSPLPAAEAVDLGLAQEVLGPHDPPPLPEALSRTALTTARDLMRARPSGRSARSLESAAFRLLFAAGDPREGAIAFLEKREPEF